MCENNPDYVLGSVWWSNKHVKSYSHPRARVHTDQGDLSRGKLIGARTPEPAEKFRLLTLRTDFAHFDTRITVRPEL